MNPSASRYSDISQYLIYMSKTFLYGKVAISKFHSFCMHLQDHVHERWIRSENKQFTIYLYLKPQSSLKAHNLTNC